VTTIAPRPCSLCLEIDPDPQEFRRASAWLRTGGASLGVPEEQIDRLELCLNEVLANLVEHGGDALACHPIQLELAASALPSGFDVHLVVSDRGEPFDSGQASPKPLPGSLEEARPGGLGLRLVKAFSDDMVYRVFEGRNELRISINWTPRS
jgi:anti-sigma regulatory factor (Ser/Thr protein kinase)